LQEISQVENSKIFQEDDDVDVFLDDDFASDSDGNQSFDDGPSSSVKRKLQTTVAGATVGKQQDRSSDKRQHKPTERLGINVALKDEQVIYATQNRTLKENRRLLMEAYKPSTRAPKQSKVQSSADSYPPQDTLLIPLFPANVLVGSQPASSSDDVFQQSATLNSSLPPITTVVDDIHQQSQCLQLHLRCYW